ncbi:AMP-binding enzyme, C-terminal domain [Dillenia turbinata]|uniref:AMP-binding enzyme, C-terminal domain n=1 Tax=Dillenia turbinata TaxID=194707 RepID=A0AAN8VI03_9MAGN
MGSYYSEAHICQCLSRIYTLRRDSILTVSGNRQKTGKEFVEGVLSLAHGLLQLGVETGHVIAISAFNSDWYLEWFLAVAFVGGIIAPLNYRWSFLEAKLAIELVSPVLLVTDDSCSSWYLDLQSHSVASIKWHVFMDSPPSNLILTENVLTTETLKFHSPKKILSFDCLSAPEGAALICFTSGTTGKPKGVTVSHSALIVQSLAKVAVVGYGEEDAYLHTAPLCHIGGLSSALAMLMVGASHVIIPKFEAKSAIKAIYLHNVTSFITVPAIMADLLSLLRKKNTRKGQESVKKILNGGGGLPLELINDATKFFPKAKLLSAYGMTETCSSMTFMTLYDPTSRSFNQTYQKLGEIKANSAPNPEGVCVGKAAPHVEMHIQIDGFSHIGRILTRGPHVMLRYWNEIPTQESDSAYHGWFDTGDIGCIDEYGNVWLVGRAKGRIKSGGENVYPEEVEAVLSQHPGVSSVVVVGLPHNRLTEMVVACVQIKGARQWIHANSNHVNDDRELVLSSEILQQYCKARNVTRFKIPRIFVLWNKPFPVTSTGKLRRDQVRREVMSQLRMFHSNL